MTKLILLALFTISAYNLLANDTLVFKITRSWHKTYDDSQTWYMRKAVLKDNGWLAFDYTLNNRLVHKGCYDDTTFERKSYCHEYFDSAKGYRSVIMFFDNNKVHGIDARFDENGDTIIRTIYNHAYFVESKDFRTGRIRKSTDTLRIADYQRIEIESEFPNGKEGWLNYLNDHLRYPKEAYRNKIEGTAVVQFIVEKDGTVSSVTVINNIDPLLAKEAIRVIENSPKWKPAIQDGMPVKSYKKQPIFFRIPGH